jgi:hypothetical protein
VIKLYGGRERERKREWNNGKRYSQREIIGERENY